MALHYRQGDVLLLEVDFIPTSNREDDSNGILLAFGEKTGHKHILKGHFVTAFKEIYGPNRYVHVGDRALLVHEEHLPFLIQAGNYRVVQQRFYKGKADEKAESLLVSKAQQENPVYEEWDYGMD